MRTTNLGFWAAVAATTVLTVGCPDGDEKTDAGTGGADASVMDTGPADTGPADAGALAVILNPVPMGLSIDEGDSQSFAVSLNRASDSTIRVRVSSANVNALQIDVTEFELTPTNWDTPQTFTLTGVQDDDTEDESVVLTITATGFDDRTFDITVVDDDVLAIATSTGAIAIGEGGTATVAVTLSAEPTSTVAVDITSADPDAAIAVQTRLVFGPTDWDQPQEVQINAPQDLDVLDESVALTFAATGLPSTTLTVAVTDDDQLSIVAAPAMATVQEGGTAVIAIDLDFAPAQDVEITIASGDPAVVTADVQRLTFTPANWDVPQNVTLTGVQDMNVVDNMSTITLSANGLRDRVVPVTVQDDDTQAIVPSAMNLMVAEGGMASVQVALAFEPAANVTVAVMVDDVGAALAMPAMLTFTPANYAAPQTVNVSGVQDLDLANENPNLTLSAQGLADVVIPIAVMDDDAQAIAVASQTVTVGEDGMANVNVTLAFQPAANVTVSLVSSDQGAATVTPTMLTFTAANYNLPQAITIAGVQDDDLSNETLSVTLSSAGVPDQVIAVTVTDDDTQSLVLSDTAITVQEGATGNVGVQLQFQPSGPVQVFVASSDPSAATVTPASLTFTAANYNVAQQITIRGVQDVDVANDTAQISLQGPGITTVNVAVTVQEDDTQAILSTANTLTVREGGQGVVGISLAFQPAANMTIAVASGDTAVAAAAPAMLTFTPGNYNIPQNVTISGVQDADTANANANVTLSSAGVADLVIAVSVTDDDTQAIVASAAAVTVGEAGTATLDVQLAFQPAADVVVAVASGDVTAATVVPTTLTFTAMNWNTAQTVTIAGVADADTVNDTTTINLSSAGLANVAVALTVTDDDTQSIVVTDLALTVDEGGTGSVGVTLAFQPSTDTTVFINSSDPTAATVNPTVLTFTAANYQTPQNITVRGIQDDDVANGTATLTLLSPGIANVTVAITITDDDVQAIQAVPTAVTVNENANANVAVRLAFRPAANVAVTVASADPTAATVNTAMLTFTPANYATPQNVRVTGIDDADTTDDSTQVVLSAAGLANANVAVTVVDDDVLNLNVTPTALTLQEGGAAGSFAVSLTQQPAADVAVTVASTDVGAATVAPGTLTFTAMNWDTPQTVTVTPVDDNDTRSETVTINVTSPGLTARAVSLTVTDDDTQAVQVAPGTLTITEGANGVFGVSLAFNPVTPVTVTIVSGDTGAVSVTPATLTFTAANFATAQNVTVNAEQDADLANEAVTVTLTSPVAPNVDVAVTVNDDDTQGLRLTQTTVALSEGRLTTVGVNLAFAPAADVTVTVASADAGAVTAGPATLTFTPANFSIPQLITLTAVQDDDTADESVAVTLTGGGATPSTITVTVDDDDLQGLVLSQTVVGLTEGGTATFDVSLQFNPVNPVTIAITSGDTGAVTGAPATLTFTAANFNTPQTVTLTGVEDDDVRDESVSINVAGAGVATVVTANVDDDDVQALVLSDQGLDVDEGGTATFTVRLQFNPLQNTSVTVVSADTGAVGVAPQTLTFTAANYATPQTVTLTGVQDDDVRDESVLVTVFSSVAPNASLTANVTDDDTQRIIVSAIDLDLNEGGTGQLLVNLEFNPLANAVVTIQSSDTGAVQFAPAQLVFTAANYAAQQIVTVTAVQDADVRDEAATLTLASGVSPRDAVVNVNVNDDDTQRIVVTPAAGLALGEGDTDEFMVSLAFDPVDTATVTLATSDAGAASLGAARFVFTSANFAVPQRLVVTAVQDNDTRDETATITFASAIAADVTASVTVDDDDVQALNLNRTGIALVEPNTDTFTVSLAFNPVDDVVVNLASSDVGAVTVTPATLTFTAANFATPQTVTVGAVDDDDINDETATINVTGAGAMPAAVTVDVDDQDVQALVLSATTLAVTEGGNATFTVRLQANPVTPTSVTLVSNDPGAATVSPTTLNFNATNWNQEQTVTVTGVIDNDVFDETPTITLTSPVAGMQTVAVTVADPNTQAILTNGLTINVTEQSSATLTVRLAFNPVTPVTVNIASSDPGAATTAPTMLTFNATNWDQPQNVQVLGTQDDDTRGETVTLTLGVGGMVAPDLVVTANVTDDDVQAILVSSTIVNVAEGGSSPVQVRLAFNPLADTVVTVASGDAGAAVGAPATLTFTAANWNVNQTLSVNGVQDADIRNETTVLTLSSPGVVSVSVNANVADDDTPSIVVAGSPVTVAEGGTGTFTVRLSFDPVVTTTVGLASSDTGAVTVGPATLSFTSANWNVAQTVTVTGVQDDDVRNEAATITMSNAIAPNATAQVDVTDDDTQTIVLTPATLPLVEGNSGTYTVRLSNNPLGPVIVNITNSDPGAATVDQATLTFDAINWAQPQTLQVTAVSDDDTRAETVNLTHASSGIANAVLTVGVADDDVQAIQFSTAALTVVEGATATFTARLAFNPVDPATVTIATSNALAATAAPTPLTFTSANWMVPQTITVTGQQDNDAADALGVLITGASAIATANSTVTVTVDDDDDQDIVVSRTAVGIVEGTTETFTVRLAQNPLQNVTVNIASSDATAVAVQTGAALSFTAANWDTPQTVTINAPTDADAGDEVVTLTLSTDPAGVAPNATVVATVDDVQVQTIQTSTSALTILEGGANRTFTVRLAFDPGEQGLTVTLTSSDVEALTVTPATLAFTSANFATPRTVTLAAPQDVDATSEAATITLSAPGAANNVLPVRVVEDDVQRIIVTPTEVLVDEGDTVNVDVRLAFRPEGPVNVTATSNALLIALVDPQVRTFTPANYDQPQSFGIQGQQDEDLDDEFTTITFDAEGLGGIPETNIDVTVNDNDIQRVIVSATTIQLTEGGLAQQLTARLAFIPSTGFGAVTLASSDTGAATVAPAGLTFTAANYDVAQAFNVTPITDLDTRNEVVQISLSEGQAPVPTVVTTNVMDDDVQAHVVAPLTQTIAEQGMASTFGVSLLFEPNGPTTVNIAATDAARLGVAPASLVFTPANYTVAQNVTVNGLADDDVIFQMIPTTISSTVAPTVTATITVTDDDTQAIQPSAPTVTIFEGDTGNFGVRLAFRPQGNTLVSLTSADGGVATVVPATMTFTPANWNMVQTATLTGTQDVNLVQNTTTVQLRMTDDLAVTRTATVTVNVDDDDEQAIVMNPRAVTVVENRDTGGTPATFTVSLAFQPGPGGEAITITSNDTGAAVATPTTLIFGPANYTTPQTVNVSAVLDNDVRDEAVVLTLASDQPLTISSTVGVTVQDADVQQVIITRTTLALTEGGATATVGVSLRFDPLVQRQVTVSSNDPGAAVVGTAATDLRDQIALFFTSANYTVPQTVIVGPVQDVDMRNETPSVTHDFIGLGADGIDVVSRITAVTVTDDDIQAIVLSSTNLNVVEGQTVNLGVRLQFEPSADQPVTLNVAPNDAAVATGAPASLTFTQANYATVQNVVITGVQDDENIDDESTFFRVVDPRDAMLREFAAARTATVTVDDDEVQQVVVTTVPANLPASVQEGGPTLGILVRLRYAPAIVDMQQETVTVTSTAPALVSFTPATLNFTAGNFGTNQTVAIRGLEDADGTHHVFPTTFRALNQSVQTVVPVSVIDDEVPIINTAAYPGFVGATLFTKRGNVRWGATRLALSAETAAGNTVMLSDNRALTDAVTGPTLGVTGGTPPTQAVEFNPLTGDFVGFATTTNGIVFASVNEAMQAQTSSLVTGQNVVDAWPEWNGTNFGLVYRDTLLGNLRFQTIGADGSTGQSIQVTVSDGTADQRPNLHYIQNLLGAGMHGYVVVFTEAGGTGGTVQCVRLSAQGVPVLQQALAGFPANAPFVNSVYRADTNRLVLSYVDPAVGLRIVQLNPNDPGTGCTTLAATTQTVLPAAQYQSPPPYIAFNGVEFAIAYDIDIPLESPQVGVALVDAAYNLRGAGQIGNGSRPSLSWAGDRWALRYMDNETGNRVTASVGAFGDHCADGLRNLDEVDVDCGGADCDACEQP